MSALGRSERSPPRGSLSEICSRAFCHKFKENIDRQRKNQSAAYEIDPVLDRHEVDDGPVLRRERLDVSSAVPVRFSERVLGALGRE
jgi:hypothetical protein